MHYPVIAHQRTSPFGMRDGVFHNGTDWISRDNNRNLVAVTSGIVVQKGVDRDHNGNRLGGNFIKIRFNYIDNRSFDGGYYHLANQSNLSVGDHIEEGQLVGIMGADGATTGVHLHYTTWLDGRYVDPELFLDTFRQAEDDEIVYRVFHEVFNQQTPSNEDVQNFRKAGFPWKTEFERVKKERNCQ